MEHLPPYYKGVREVEKLKKIIEPEVQLLLDRYKQLRDDQFILKAGRRAIERYEGIYEIHPNRKIPIAERRKRVWIKKNSRPPFTLEYLKRNLDLMVGEGAYFLTLPEPFVMHIEILEGTELLIHEVKTFVRRIIPANIGMKIIVTYITGQDLYIASLTKGAEVIKITELTETNIPLSLDSYIAGTMKVLDVIQITGRR